MTLGVTWSLESVGLVEDIIIVFYYLSGCIAVMRIDHINVQLC